MASHLDVIPVNHVPAIGPLGIYSCALSSGAIAATLGANSDLLSFRWGDATRLCLIRSVNCSGVVSGVITTAVNFDLALFQARSFSVSPSGGTAATLTGSNQKQRANMGTSLVTALQVANTGALTAGTRTLDAQPVGRVQGFTGTAAGTLFFGGGTIPLIERRMAGNYPIVLANNEGIVVQNPLAGPATGTFNLVFTIEWQEVSAF